MDSKLKLEIVSLKTELAEKSSSDEKLQQKYDLLKEEKEKVELEFSGLQKMVRRSLERKNVMSCEFLSKFINFKLIG